MELKQLEYSKRIEFLIRFTAEIIDNKLKEERTQENIKVEKLKQKIIEPLMYKEETPQVKINPFSISKEEKPAEKIVKIPSQAPSGYRASMFDLSHEELKSEIIQPAVKELNVIKPMQMPQKTITPPKQMLPQKQAPQMQQLRQSISQKQTPAAPLKNNLQQQKPMIQKTQQIPQKNMQRPNQFKSSISQGQSAMKAQIIQEIKPESTAKPQGFNLGKIEQFLKDPLIQSIECPGQGQNLLIKKYNKIQGTNISLTQQEINDIVTNFSMQAKIPVFGGVLKAAVGDLIISAVVSEVIGSRFVINKIASHR